MGTDGCLCVCAPGYQPGPESSQAITSSLLYHEFAVPQHPGRAGPPSLAGLDSGDGSVTLLLPVLPNTQASSCTPEESQERGSANRNGTVLARRTAWPAPSTRCRGKAQRSASSFSPSLVHALDAPQQAPTRVVSWCCCSAAASVSLAQLGQVMGEACFHLILAT